MKLALALLCVEMDCQEVFESTTYGFCPSCGSSVALPMSQIFNREAEPTHSSYPAVFSSTPAEHIAPKQTARPQLRLVVPDRSLESPITLMDSLPETQHQPRITAPTSACLSVQEGAELTDFRHYLEERMGDFDEIPQDTRVHVAMTG